MIEHDVVATVHRVEHGFTNCYQIDLDDATVLVDAGFPRTWARVEASLAQRNRRADQIAALLITHGHFDHLGFARLLSTRHRVPVWAHREEPGLLRHPYSYRPERPRGLYPLAYPRALPVLGGMVAAGALTVPGQSPQHLVDDDEVLDLPGHPRVIHVPGHTPGSCLFVFDQQRAVFTGDALVTLDPYTGHRGPSVVARAATASRRAALVSLRRAAERVPDDYVVLPGHGQPWRDGFSAAVDLAWRHGGR